MFIVKKDNTINISGDIAGGHAYLLNEWRSDNYIGIQNSWGYDWGKNGKAYISASDFEKLFVYDGEALTAVELDSATGTTVPHNCILIDIINNIFGINKVKIHIK
jgi:glycogen synthase